jgi:hypothetical protein
MQRLRADADRGRDQDAEALTSLRSLPQHLGGSGLWLAVAVAPQYLLAEPAMISPDQAQQFLGDWHMTQAPIENIAQSTATPRQPGGVVITSQAGIAEPAWFWRLALHDDGEAAGAFVVEQDAASGTDATRWFGLPRNIIDGQTIVVRRDLIEINLLTLLDALTAHATAVGAGGRAVLTAALITPSADAWRHVAVVTELVDDVLQPQGWRLASASAHQSRDLAIMAPVTHEVQLADMRDTTLRLRAAYRLAAELLAIFSIDQPAVLKDDGTLDSAWIHR